MTNDQDLQPARWTLLVDNERVRVTRWNFPEQSETGHHVHAHDYVVVPVVPGRLRMVDASGEQTLSELTLGGAYARPAGVSHNVINDGPDEVAFVEVELK